MTKPLLALLLTATAIPLLAQPPSAAPAGSSADQALRALYDAEWTWRQAEFARGEGGADGPADSDHFPRVDPASQQARLAYWRRTRAALDRIPVADLGAEERINAAVFRTRLDAFIANAGFRAWEMPFNSDSNFWSGLAPETPYRTTADYRRYIARMRDLPRYFDEHIANMRAGLKRGFTVPRVTLAGRDASIAPYAVRESTANPFYAAFAVLPAGLSPGEQAAMRADARDVIARSVAPAYARLLAFYRDEYVPGARTTLAAEAMPDGKAWYAAQIREYTTTNLTADRIHAIGLAEVARIDADMRRTMRASGFKGSFAAFQTFLRTDPMFYARTPDALLGVSAYVAKRVDGELKHVIGFLPRYRFTIRPVPDAIAPFYTAGRGGLESCMMNTHDLPSRPLYQIPALTLHECNPGHSLQAAIAREGPDRPAFRRATYFSGYGEGWGLYTEWLGTRMGIYRTPYEEFGRQSYEMWRACRLVIDTGIHHAGWTRDRAIAYLSDHSALSAHEVATEVDRYISWPAQALAYKLGEMTLRRKRADAERVLADRFDQRWFHDMILNLGSVPLPVLEQQIDAWIAAGGPNTRNVGTPDGGAG